MTHHSASPSAKTFLFAIVLAGASLLVLTPDLCAQGDPRLVGRWSGGPEYYKVSCVFSPDGRYFLTARATGVAPTQEHGQYAVNGTTLTFTTAGGDSNRYEMTLSGDMMHLKGPLELTVQLEPGSKEGVLKEIAQSDAAKRREDAEWARRFPLGQLQPGPRVAVGMPEDSNPKRVFENATVFATLQNYVRFWNMMETWVVTEGPDPGNGKSQSQFYFFPNGRCFFRNIRYSGPAAQQGRPRPGKVEVFQVWGRYRIDDLEKGSLFSEPLLIETDAGEVIKNRLIDGRRNFRWSNQHTVGNVIWETYALQKANGDNPRLPKPSSTPDGRPLPADGNR